jgi:rare lipoprotein A
MKIFLLLLFIFITSSDKSPRYRAEGLASYYSFEFHGNRTASGERFDLADLTAAHLHLPFGTYLKVTNKQNQKSVVVRINDRGPYLPNRIIDLSESAARLIDGFHPGVIPVILEEVKLLIPDAETDSLYRHTRVMDCLGNPETLGKLSLTVWSTRHLPHILYIANQMYLQEAFEKIYICHHGQSRRPTYHLVISHIKTAEELERLKNYFTQKGFLRVFPYSH